MEEYFVPAVVEAALVATPPTSLSNEQIATFTLGCTGTIASAVRKWNRDHPHSPISAQAGGKYVRHYTKTGSPFVPQKRGPKELLTSEATQEVVRARAPKRTREPSEVEDNDAIEVQVNGEEEEVEEEVDE